jgi:uncharacterized protein (TIGR03437 family)
VAAANQDGTVNGSSTPCRRGQRDRALWYGKRSDLPAGRDRLGDADSHERIRPLEILGTVTATIGGQPATVRFAGAAPGFVTGVFQVNVQIPSGIGTGTWPVTLSINGVPITSTSATIAVQ